VYRKNGLEIAPKRHFQLNSDPGAADEANDHRGKVMNPANHAKRKGEKKPKE
jgi:hypothetical protein